MSRCSRLIRSLERLASACATGFAQAGDVAGIQVFGAQDLASQDYVHETIGFTATGPATSLSAYAFDDRDDIELDDVSVNAVSVPEPGNLPFMLAGLLMASASIAPRRRGRS